MERRERAFLWRKQGQEWAAPLRPWAESLGFRRGFAENVIVADRKAESVLTCVREVLRRAPVRYLEVESWWNEEADISELAPDMARLKGLMLTNVQTIEEFGLERLLASPHLAGLEILVVACNHNGIVFRPELFQAVVASPHWSRLSVLVLQSGCYVGLDDAAVLALAQCASLGALTCLDLGHAEMSPATAEALAHAQHLALQRSEASELSWPFLP